MSLTLQLTIKILSEIPRFNVLHSKWHITVSLWQELMGRPINLKFSEKNVGDSGSQNVGDSGSQKEEGDSFEGQPQES